MEEARIKLKENIRRLTDEHEDQVTELNNKHEKEMTELKESSESLVGM